MGLYSDYDYDYVITAPSFRFVFFFFPARSGRCFLDNFAHASSHCSLNGALPLAGSMLGDAVLHAELALRRGNVAPFAGRVRQQVDDAVHALVRLGHRPHRDRVVVAVAAA